MIDAARLVRAALISVALAGTMGAAMPAQAQGFTFGFGFGVDDDRRVLPRRLCILTDRGLREAIADQGYRNIFLNVPVGRYVQARASRGDWVYLLKVHVCTGEVVERERLRRR